jgi:hypothetical protein
MSKKPISLKSVCFYHFSGHPWVQIGGLAPDKPLDSAVLSRMKQFSAMNKLKKMALRVSINWKIILVLPCVRFLAFKLFLPASCICILVWLFTIGLTQNHAQH